MSAPLAAADSLEEAEMLLRAAGHHLRAGGARHLQSTRELAWEAALRACQAAVLARGRAPVGDESDAEWLAAHARSKAERQLVEVAVTNFARLHGLGCINENEGWGVRQQLQRTAAAIASCKAHWVRGERGAAFSSNVCRPNRRSYPRRKALVSK